MIGNPATYLIKKLILRLLPKLVRLNLDCVMGQGRF